MGAWDTLHASLLSFNPAVDSDLSNGSIFLWECPLKGHCAGVIGFGQEFGPAAQGHPWKD
jgi:hypothetical protein